MKKVSAFKKKTIYGGFFGYSLFLPSVNLVGLDASNAFIANAHFNNQFSDSLLIDGLSLAKKSNPKTNNLFKKVGKYIGNYGGWNTAVMAGLGMSVATSISTSGMNIANSLKSQSPSSVYYELGQEPVLITKLY